METKKVVNLPVHIFENRAQMGVAAAADAAKRINAIIETLSLPPLLLRMTCWRIC